MTDGWHFLSADRMTRYEPRMPVIVGETLRVDPPIALCERGLHASVRAIDALQYAPGPIICRVRLGGEIKTGDDKLVATERTVLWMYDATNVLHEMACMSAEAKRAWLRGEIDDAELAAARAAAWDAAWAAARDAAGDAARDAAGDAAGDEQNYVFELLLNEGRP